MSSLRFALNEHGHIRPNPEGEWVPYQEWVKAAEGNKEATKNAYDLALKVTELEIQVAVLKAEAKLIGDTDATQ
jgi:hypothetical protein